MAEVNAPVGTVAKPGERQEYMSSRRVGVANDAVPIDAP